MTAREKFKVGDRVRLTAKALSMMRSGRIAATGEVIGFPRRQPESLTIRRDGRKVPIDSWMGWWETDPKYRPATERDTAGTLLVPQ